MASCPFSSPASAQHRRYYHAPSPVYTCTTVNTNSTALCFPSSHKSNLRRSFHIKRNPWSGSCHATGPPSEPTPKKSLAPFSGAKSSLARFQDTFQIFFAVLFWMSLFFWSSAWDREDGGGRRNKRSRFRK